MNTKLQKKTVVGINGFGRFGLHLLKYWLTRQENSSFLIQYINDENLNIDQCLEIILNDKFVTFHKYKIKKINNIIRFIHADGLVAEIEFTKNKSSDISWLGKPKIFMECSGRNVVKKDCLKFIKGETELVVISATSWDVDSTIVFGYNEKDFDNKFKVISYGSCTVNAFLPLANLINNKYGIVNSDVNVIHNIQEYKLSDNYTLTRKFCTLEKQGPALLPFLNEDNFNVNYTVIPYPGVSTFDFRFTLQDKVNTLDFIDFLENELKNNQIGNLYEIMEDDLGPEVVNCTTYSAVIIKNQIKVRDDQVYLFSYFDNENSVNRYYDLIEHILLSY